MSALRDELLNDPLTRGYAAMTDEQAAASLNTADRTITAQYVSGSDVFNATDDVEYAALTEAQKQAWDALCAIDQIDTSNGVAKAREAELFGPGTATRSNLVALRQSTVSRAVELSLGRVRAGEVKHARA